MAGQGNQLKENTSTTERTKKVEVRNVRKVYKSREDETKDVIALNGVDLDIYDNEIVTVVGPSGCGKSTLMDIIGGLNEQTSGEVYMDGKEVKGISSDRGVVFQEYALFPWLTVGENVRFGLDMKGIPKEEGDKIAQKYIDNVSLTDFVNSYPKELSGGMKQRVAIARAYANDPSILLMDEPFGAVDAQTRVQLQDELLNMWKQENKTIFFITHDVDEAVYLGHRVIIMSARPGRIKEIVDVDIPHPRDSDVKLSDEFTDVKNYVWSQVYSEYLEVKK